MDKNAINERFIKAVSTLFKDKGLTKAGIAESLGLKPSTFSEILNNRMKAGTDTIAALCDKYSFSPFWILMGQGTMFIPGELKGRSKPSMALAYSPDRISELLESQKTSPYPKREKAHRVPDNSNEGIPLIPLSAMAGAFTGDTSVMEYECERYVIPAFKGADFLIQVKGDSMQPTYYSGDLVACQRVPLDDLFFQWNKTYVLDTKQGPLIKRIMPGSDSSHVLIVSDNDSYPPFELSKSQFHGVALVRGLVRLE